MRGAFTPKNSLRNLSGLILADWLLNTVKETNGYTFVENQTLYSPVRTGLVLRPRLIERLSAGLGQSGFVKNHSFAKSLGFARKLALISAPAGFGKTTLVRAWIQQSEQPVAWLSLDENDNDLARFFTYVVAAL